MEYLTAVNTATVLANINLNLTLKCVSILTESTKGIYNLIIGIDNKLTYMPDIKKEMDEMDIGVQVQVIELLLLDIDVTKHFTQTLGLCIENLKTCVLEIEKTLKEMDENISYNNSLWFFKISRSYNVICLINKLKTYKINLINRKDLLFDILKINNHLRSNRDNDYVDNHSDDIVDPDICHESKHTEMDKNI